MGERGRSVAGGWARASNSCNFLLGTSRGESSMVASRVSGRRIIRRPLKTFCRNRLTFFLLSTPSRKESQSKLTPEGRVPSLPALGESPRTTWYSRTRQRSAINSGSTSRCLCKGLLPSSARLPLTLVFDALPTELHTMDDDMSPCFFCLLLKIFRMQSGER